MKNTEATAHWYIYDSVREPNDSKGEALWPNRSNGNTSYYERLKFTDTGFQLLSTDTDMNGNGTKYVYMAFADKREYAYWLDQSGNNNDWTSNNLTESDISVDSPTNNFCTMNPLSPNTANLTFSEGNLKLAGWDIGFFGTMGVSSGKWYWEMHSTNASGNANNTSAVGIVHSDALYDTVDSSSNDGFQLYGGTNKARGYYGYAGNKLDASSNVSYGDAFVTGDIIGVALNLDDGEITFYKNNVSQGVAFTSLGSGEWFPLWQNWTSSVGVMNFGQDSSFSGIKTAQGNQDGNSIGDFYYTPPTGFLALCTKNLPDVAVTPSEHFETILYTGTGSEHEISSLNFQPDLAWIKERPNVSNHYLYDSVRGATKVLYSDGTFAEQTDAQSLKSFDSDGYTLGTNTGVNQSSTAYVSWNWKANGSGSSNTDGSITSTVSANTDAGFSIVGWTGNATAGATVGHGLSKTPEIIILKDREGTTNWSVYHASNTSAPETEALALNTTDATSDYLWWNDTAPTSSVFSLGAISNTNANGNDFIAYCFHSVNSYSAVGSYTGNSNADGIFVYTSFAPSFILFKKTNGSEAWRIYHNKVEPYNPNKQVLLPNDSGAEGGANNEVDFLSSGFKIRTSWNGMNGSGDNYIYLAFAETPFKNSNAR